MLPCNKRFYKSIIFGRSSIVRLMQNVPDLAAYYWKNYTDNDRLLSTNFHITYHQYCHLYIQRDITFHREGIRMYRACQKLYFEDFNTLLYKLDMPLRQEFLLFYYQFTLGK